MRFGVLFAAFVSVSISGCAASDMDDAPAVTEDTTSTAAAATGSSLFDVDGSASAPILNVGDWWRYKVAYTTGESYDATIVVHSDEGSKVQITADNNDLLLRALFTHYPTFGSVNKANLDHAIHGADVPFLRFPMKNQTWEAPYRDFTGQFESTYAMLPTGNGTVPGFVTTMMDADDGQVRLVNGWSPVTKYFTSFQWDFDGIDPIDVHFELQAWGSGYSGSVPVLEVTEGVHRAFPTQSVAPPNPAGPPPTSSPEARATFRSPEGSDLVFGMFAGAGGPGNFEMVIGNADRAADYPWRPTAAGSYFDWDTFEDVPAGEWNVMGAGSAQNFAFLFLEAYAVKTTTIEM